MGGSVDISTEVTVNKNLIKAVFRASNPSKEMSDLKSHF